MLLAPTLGDRLPIVGAARVAFGTVASILLTAPLLLAALWTLGQSIDLKAADRLGSERTQLACFGELDVDFLECGPLDGFPGRCRLTVAYTSRSTRLLVVPRLDRLAPLLERSVVSGPDGTGYLPDPERSPLRVVDSSLDFLPDRALLIEPKATRIAEYTIAVSDDSSGEPLANAQNAPNFGMAPYAVTFYRRDDDGGFLTGIAPLWAPRGVTGMAQRTSALPLR